MSKTLVVCLVLSSCLGAVAASAGPVVYRCTLPNRPIHSFLSKRLDIAFFPRARRARAVDGLIWQKFHHAIPVRVDRIDDRRVTFQWVVRNVPGRSRGMPTTVPGVRETATVLSTGALFVTQYPLSADNSFSAQGRCTKGPFHPRRG